MQINYSSRMVNKTLLIGLNTNWTGISRLPSGLSRAGFKVFALCPRSSYLGKTKFLNNRILYPTFTYSRSKLVYLWIVLAIMFWSPDIIIPGDEDAILALQGLSNTFEGMPFFGNTFRLIRSSLTSRGFDSLILSKSLFQEKCVEWGVRAPKDITVKNLNEAQDAAKVVGYPLVLKRETGYGGAGVFICQTDEDLKKIFQLNTQHSHLFTFKTFLKKLFFISIFSNENKISVQQYIVGKVGIAPFSAVNGKIVAINTMLKHRTYPGETGPTSVALGINNSEIEQFAAVIVEKLGYTGFGALDFIIEEKSGLPYVIELNARPTPLCHVSDTIVSNDLCLALHRGLNGVVQETNVFKPYTIAVFPNEKKRDPQSSFLVDAYHDIPLNDPDLLEALDSNK